MRRTLILALTAVAVVLPTFSMAQSNNKLVGTWKLVSVVSKTDKGDLNSAW